MLDLFINFQKRLLDYLIYPTVEVIFLSPFSKKINMHPSSNWTFQIKFNWQMKNQTVTMGYSYFINLN